MRRLLRLERNNCYESILLLYYQFFFFEFYLVISKTNEINLKTILFLLEHLGKWKSIVNQTSNNTHPSGVPQHTKLHPMKSILGRNRRNHLPKRIDIRNWNDSLLLPSYKIASDCCLMRGISQKTNYYSFARQLFHLFAPP